MYVKTSWRTYKGKRYISHHLAEAYRDPETGKARARMLLNLSPLPDYVIEAIKESLKTGKSACSSQVQIHTGDSLRGAGLLAIYRSWKHEQLDQVLANFTEAERQSLWAMVAQRILEPGSKLSLQRKFRDTLFAMLFSNKRLDEDELYRVMDVLHENFYQLQERLTNRRKASPVLCLYDITSTYFEGTYSDEGEYGHSRDKRWDRYQIVIGLVCDEEGIPMAVEIWPGNTADKSTVVNRAKMLKERFKIEKAVFVGDSGMYSETNIESLEQHGFDYILNTDWQTQRKQLETLAPGQLGLFDEQGVAEWEHDGVRYVGCVSEFKRARAARRREKGMESAYHELEKLASTAAKGSYYSWTRLREKVNEKLSAAGVKDLWQTTIAYLDNPADSPEKKALLRLTFHHNEDAIAQRMGIEGKYVLRTSLSPEASCHEIDGHYRGLQKAERAFRHIKSYLKVRPVYHRLRHRVRAHVLICFLAYYLVKRMELELRAKGITEEVEELVQRWDHLHLVDQRLDFNGHTHKEWQWSLGDIGKEVQEELIAAGWWRSIDAYRRSLTNSLPSDA